MPLPCFFPTQSAIPSNIPKRMRRILANRASAARSKERKKAIVELEEQVAELQQQRQAQDGQMHELTTSNATLGARRPPCRAAVCPAINVCQIPIGVVLQWLRMPASEEDRRRCPSTLQKTVEHT